MLRSALDLEDISDLSFICTEVVVASVRVGRVTQGEDVMTKEAQGQNSGGICICIFGACKGRGKGGNFEMGWLER